MERTNDNGVATMRIDNPFEMNDWEIGKLLRFVAVVQLAWWGAMGLDAFGLHMPLLRQAVGFVYLSFIPGVLILRVLRLHNLGSVRTILFATGLSVTLLMLVGLLMNMAYPLIGIPRPLSFTPLVATISFVVMALCSLSYLADRHFSAPTRTNVRGMLVAPVLFLVLLPILGVLGSLLVRFYHSNTLLLGVIAAIAGVAVLGAFGRFISPKFYPLAIVTIAIVLLTHRQLVFAYPFGTDIQNEYYVYRLAMESGRWDPSAWPTTYNAMLSISILPAIYSVILEVDGIWLFRTVYPFFASLIPLGLYEVYRRQSDERTAFLSVFFFMSFFTFFGELTYLAKQQVAELFFSLVILLLFSRDLYPPKGAALFVAFTFSLVVSHYGVAYYYIFFMFTAWVAQYLSKLFTKEHTGAVLMGGPVIALVLTLSWYMYVSNATVFNTTVGVGEYIWSDISDITDLSARDPRVLQATGLSSGGVLSQSVHREIAAWLNRVTYLLIVIGFLSVLVKRKETGFTPVYMGLVAGAMLVLAAAVVIPTFSYAAMTMSRIYHVALFFLSPLAIIGGKTIPGVIGGIAYRMRLRNGRGPARNSIGFMYITLLILVPYFLYNVGFVFEVVGDQPTSVALSQEKWKNTENLETKAQFYNSYRPEQDISGVTWLGKHRDNQAKVYSDGSVEVFLLRGYGMIETGFHAGALYHGNLPSMAVDANSHIYLGYFNTMEHVMVTKKSERTIGSGKGWGLYGVAKIEPLLEASNRIYMNGGSEIFYTRPEQATKERSK